MSHRKLPWVVVGILALGAGACSSADDTGDEPEGSQEGRAIAFCQDFFAAMSQQLWRCGCTQPALDVCEFQQSTCAEMGFFASLEEGLAQGLVRYDAHAAEQVLARVRDDPTACADQFVVLGWDSYEGQTFGGAFIGTLEAGSECGGADDKTRAGASFCREGLLCLPAADGSNRCVAAAAAGAPCPVVPGYPASSCLERKPADPDGSFTSAEAGLTCVPDASGSETGTCSPRLANGSDCTDPAECASGRCQFTVEPPVCAERVPGGADCLIDEDCATRACRYEDASASLGVCASPGVLPPGSPCMIGTECESGWCEADLCQAAICIDYAELASR